MTRADVNIARKRFATEFDERPDLQQRWKILYQHKRRLRREAMSAPGQQPSGSQARSGDVAPWSHELGGTSQFPLAPAKLDECEQSFAQGGLGAMVKGVRDFTVCEVDTEEQQRPKLTHLRGCSSEWHNVCPKHINEVPGRLRRFLVLRSALNKWVDGLVRKDIQKCDTLLCFCSQSDDGPFFIVHLDVVVCCGVQTQISDMRSVWAS